MAEIGLFDPFLTFKFKLYFDGGAQPVAGIQKVGPIKRKTEAIMWRDGAHPHNSQSAIPGGSTFETISFEQGLGLDDGQFEDWALSVSDWKNGDGAFKKANYRRTLRIEFLDMTGELAKTTGGRKLNYVLDGAWVSEYQAMPELDSKSLNTIGISSFTVNIEGWRRQQ